MTDSGTPELGMDHVRLHLTRTSVGVDESFTASLVGRLPPLAEPIDYEFELSLPDGVAVENDEASRSAAGTADPGEIVDLERTCRATEAGTYTLEGVARTERRDEPIELSEQITVEGAADDPAESGGDPFDETEFGETDDDPFDETEFGEIDGDPFDEEPTEPLVYRLVQAAVSGLATLAMGPVRYTKTLFAPFGGGDEPRYKSDHIAEVKTRVGVVLAALVVGAAIALLAPDLLVAHPVTGSVADALGVLGPVLAVGVFTLSHAAAQFVAFAWPGLRGEERDAALVAGSLLVLGGGVVFPVVLGAWLLTTPVASVAVFARHR